MIAAAGPGPVHVLVVDDEPAQRRALARVLLARGFQVDTAEGGGAALDLCRTRPVDVVLLDRDMPDLDGLAVLAQLRRSHPEVEVVLMVPLDDPAAAAPALHAGVFAVVTKPLPAPEAAVPPVERAAERRRLLDRARALEKQIAEQDPLGEIVGSSARMVELRRRASAAATSSAPVLVLGERGTGKDLLGRFVHRRSNRARGPLVALRALYAGGTPAPPGELGEEAATADLASALEEAEGGTLLLDDLGALPRAAQAHLARALSAPRRADVRVIATGLPDLRERVASGAFREDLFYGLAAVLLEVPPLRRRREDVPLLAYHFLGRFAAREGKTLRRIAGEALKALRRHDWPGNVGELRGAIEHAVVMARGTVIQVGDLPLGQDEEDDREPGAGVAFADGDVLDMGYPEAKQKAVAVFDRAYVDRAMERAGGNVSEAARLSGLDRSNFRRLLKKARER